MRSFVINIARLIVSLTFILSGFVKAVDPHGTQYKLQEYAGALGLADAFPGWVLLTAAVGLAMLEFVLGITLLFAISRRLTTRVILVFMTLMTIVTLWIWIANPVSDCGCFGDAIKLTNGETLLKNVVLLALSVLLAYRPYRMPRMVSLANQWIVFHYTMIFIVGVSVYSLYYLPLFDFRPYHIGANIPEGMEIPEGAPQPEFETTFVMEKDGVRKEFTIDNYPDSTWTFVDSKTTVLSEGYVPPIHDFSIQRISDGADITEEVLNKSGYTFLLVSPHLEHADDSEFGEIDQIYEYAQENGYPFYCLTASGSRAIAHWQDVTGAEYPFCNTDETTLKTMIRSNPGLLLLNKGTVVGKWSHNDLPTQEMLSEGKISSSASYLPHGDEVAERIAYILTWFVLPLALLVFADRLWMWSQWVREKQNRQSNKIRKLIKKEKK